MTEPPKGADLSLLHYCAVITMTHMFAWFLVKSCKFLFAVGCSLLNAGSVFLFIRKNSDELIVMVMRWSSYLQSSKPHRSSPVDFQFSIKHRYHISCVVYVCIPQRYQHFIHVGDLVLYFYISK